MAQPIRRRVEGIRSRGVVVSIASYLLSSLGLALSILTSLLDLFFGHDAVAHLLVMLTGQEPLKQQPIHRHAAPPSEHRKHHRHHSHHHRHQGQASILLPTTTPFPNNERSSSLPTLRSRSPVPIIAIHHHDLPQFKLTPSSPRSPQYPSPDVSSASRWHHQPKSAPPETQIRERKTSLTFVHPTDTPRSPGSGKMPLPPLGTSPAQFRQSHRRGLSRCSSSPNLSTPPATPAGSSPTLLTPTSTAAAHKHQNTGEVDMPTPKVTGTASPLVRMLRRVPSAPGPLFPDAQKVEEVTRKAFVFSFSNGSATSLTNKSEKEIKSKRSQTALSSNLKSKPRTSPYEAPYFCELPQASSRISKDNSFQFFHSKSAPVTRPVSPDL